MDESLKLAEKILDEKLDRYGSKEMNNFVASDEITVTITLNEYRDLVSSKATTDYKVTEANGKRYDAEGKLKTATEELNALRQENVSLKEEVYNLKRAIEKLTTEAPATSVAEEL